MPNLQPNQRVGEYLLDARIGGGAFGEVWRARHHVWADRLVAIKVPTSSDYLRTLQREGSALHGLVHPNVVKAVAFDPFADPPYLVMELVPGTSLRPLVKARALNAGDAVRVLRQVLAGLGHAHERGLVHRDVKPENILIDERAKAEGYGVVGLVKVTDFGLGRATQVAATQSIAFSASLNSDAGRELAGTLDYMAPEQRAGDPVDGRADLYACGVVLYELLTGERPAGTDLPSDVVPGVPRFLDEAFRRSYARLEKRFTSAAEFSDALGDADRFDDRSENAAKPQAASGAYGATDAIPIAGRRGCPQCRQAVDASDQFCMHCGTQLVPVVKRCSACGAYPDPADRFCIFCGHDQQPRAAMPAGLGR